MSRSGIQLLMRRLIIFLLLVVHSGIFAHFETERIQAYQRDIPSFSKGNFFKKQEKLLLAAEKAFDQQSCFRLEDYPHGDKHPYIHYITDRETNEIIAIFKSQGPRTSEVLTWELSGIFGLEDVLTPSMPLTLYGISGELQLYQKNDVTRSQSYIEELFPLITFDSYLKCALAVLLFALEDMHNENCFYQFCREGYAFMGLFDTKVAFCQAKFFPLGEGSDFPSLQTPFNWIGWDFPQADRIITGKFKTWLEDLMKSWPERTQDASRYFEHPMTPYDLTEKQKREIIERAEILSNLISNNSQSPASRWHELLVPDYPLVAEKLRDVSPAYNTTWLLFRLQWFPERFYSDWIAPELHEEFKEWLKQFLERC